MFDLIPFSAPWQALSNHRYSLGESPRHAHGQLRWLDIQARCMHRIDIDSLSNYSESVPDERPLLDGSEIHTQEMPDQIACILPSQDPAVWIGCGREAIWMIRDDGQHSRILQAPFDPAWQRFNDGCCDEWGRIWVSSLIDDKRAPLAGLWCLQQGQLHPVLQGLTTGNGLAYSARHHKLFLADTFTRTIRRFDVDAQTPTLTSDGWQFTYQTGTERPDGACMIDETHYAVAVIDGHRLDVFDLQDDTAPACIPVPLHKPTMPCIIPKPAPALVLTSATVATANALSQETGPQGRDGFVLVKRLAHAVTSAHVYRI